MVAANRGALIAIEGIDGAGTTTQARLLVEWFGRAGLAAHLTCEPSTGPVGQLIRSVLRRETTWPLDPAATALLFAADRVDHCQHEILPHLQAGTHVITDRFVYSSLAYQSLHQDLDWVESINHLAPEPDLTVYIRVSPDLARCRREARGGVAEIFDDNQLQERISAKYDLLLGSRPEDGAWIRSDPSIESGWIRSTAQQPRVDLTGSARVATTRRPVTAILDGSLPVQELHEQLCALCENVARTART